MAAAVLIVLVAAAPWIASTGAVVGWGVGLANEQIRGNLDVQGVSLSWLSPCRIDGVRLADPNGRVVLAVERLATSTGLWGLLTGWGDVGTVHVASPRVTLYRDAGGGVSIARAVRPRRPTAEKPPAEPFEPPALRGRIVVAGGSVAVIEADGRRYDLPRLEGDFSLATLDEITGSLLVGTAGGGLLRTEVHLVHVLSAGGQGAPALAAAATVTTEQPVDLAPLGRFALPGSGLKGTATVSLSAELDGLGPRGTVSATVTDLAAAVAGAAGGEPVDLALAGRVASDPNGALRGDGRLGGDCGTLRWAFFRPAGETAPPAAEDLLAAVLAGRPLDIPAVRFDANGLLDIARLLRAVPALANVRKDVRVETGRLRLREIAFRGGPRPRVGGTVTLTGLAARRGEAAIRWKPLSVHVDAALVPDVGVDLRAASLLSEFATLDANGTPKALRATWWADLAVLARRLGEVFDTGGLTLAGTAEGRARLALEDPNTAAVRFGAELAGLKYARGGGATFSLASAALDGGGAVLSLSSRPVLRTNGRLTLSEPALDGNALSDRPVVAEWNGVSYATARRELAVAKATLSGMPLSADANDVTARFGRTLGLEGRVELTADLARCAALAARGGDANRPVPVAGVLRLVGRAVAGPEGTTLTGEGDVTDLRFGEGRRAVRLRPVRLWQSARLDAAGRTLRIDSSRVESDAVTLAVAGSVTRLDAEPNAALTVTFGADLAAVTDIARALTPPAKAEPNAPPPSRITGRLDGSAAVTRSGRAGAFHTSGRLKVVGLAADGNSLAERPVEAEWTDLHYAERTGRIALASATLTGAPARAEMKNFAARLGEKLQLDGTVTVSADLGRLAALAAALRRRKPAELAGTLHWSARAGQAGQVVSLDGRGEVQHLAVGPKARRVRIEPLTFSHAARIDPNGREIRIVSFDANSSVLSLRGAGTVRRYDAERDLDITGHYSGDWRDLTALLHAISPNSTDIAFAGRVDSDFALKGPASDPKLTPAFRRLGASAGVGWQSGEVVGFRLGPAELPLALRDGRVVLPRREIPASGGTIRLDGAVDLRGESPVLHLPAGPAVLEGVGVNRKVAEEFLSRFNPVFGHLVAAEGSVSLTVTEPIVLPLDADALRRRGVGRGRLDLSGMRIRPGGLMSALLRLGGLSEAETHRLAVSPVDFHIAGGAIHYDNFTMTFDGNYPLAFRGAVRFDETVELEVGVPVSAALLEKLGVRGPVAEYARLLEGARIGIPLGGTRREPRLDFSRVDPMPLVRKAAEALLREKAGGLLDGVLDRGRGRQPDRPPRPRGLPELLPDLLPGRKPPPAPTTRPAPTPPKKPEDQIIEGLFDILRGRDEKK